MDIFRPQGFTNPDLGPPTNPEDETWLVVFTLDMIAGEPLSTHLIKSYTVVLV